MKKQIISVILTGVLVISMTGCSSHAGDIKKVQANKQAAAAETQKPVVTAEAKKPADKQKGKKNTEAAQSASAPQKKTNIPAAKAKPEKKQTTAQAKKPGGTAPANEFYNYAPATSIDTVQISARHVYYKGSELYMDAYVYNGFKHTIYDIHNIEIKISNKSGVIARANFDGMGNAQIAPQSYIVWTFVFGPDMVMKQNADLSAIKTEYQCDNAY